MCGFIGPNGAGKS
ncbi:MAG: hypothetical protein MI725_04055, partial [Pirellulales bacterium]|nr:hypothetical protein [Pirellulales bacterium]